MKLWLAIGMLSLLLGCSGEITDPRALACGRVVERHLGLQRGIAVTEAAENASGDGLEIAYEGSDGENLPVEGTADCSFEADTVRVIAARVGNHLVPADALSE